MNKVSISLCFSRIFLVRLQLNTLTTSKLNDGFLGVHDYNTEFSSLFSKKLTISCRFLHPLKIWPLMDHTKNIKLLKIFRGFRPKIFYCMRVALRGRLIGSFPAVNL
jgi:hypothetical protein